MLFAALKADFRTAAGLDRTTRALLDFAARLTLDPTGLAAADLDPLRSAGLDDRAILDAAHVAGFFNHINRVADALGVDLEDFMSSSRSGPAATPEDLELGA